MNEISKYYNSFSGTDTLAFMLLPDTPPITLGALTTISYSVYRDKKPVNVMGNINVKGFTRGTRVVAGTLVFTLINKHWVNDVVDSCPWLKDFRSLKADELPMFDIMIVSANEYGTTASMFIYGVDITDESQVLSVEDLFTENQFSYLARDVDTFDSKIVGGKEVSFRSVKELTGFNDWDILMDTAVKKSTEVNDGKIAAVQEKLQEIGYTGHRVTGVMDKETEQAIIQYQEENNLPVTGYIDRDTELKITEGTYEGKDPVIIADKNGSLIYKDATTQSDIVLQLPYSTKIVVLSKDGEWYRTTQGYVHEDSVSVENILLAEEVPSYLSSTVPFGTITLDKDYSVDNAYTVVELMNDFEINILLEETSTCILEVMGYYSEGRVLAIRKVFNILPMINKEIMLDDFRNLFIFNEEMEEDPYMTEVFLQIDGRTYKWVIKHR